MHNFRLILAAWLLWTTSAVAQTVTASNSTTWQPGADKTHTLLLEINRGLIFFYLQPLNNASYTPIAEAAAAENGLQGTLYLAQEAVHNNWTNQDIALIPCDPYPGEITVQDVTLDAIATNVTAIIFYSLTSLYCNATSEIFSPIFSTTNVQNASYLSSPMNDGSMNKGVIFTEAAFDAALASEEENGSPSTAVAMIILYSITGVITALFLLIIVTGAVRAHRHPERYGPRNFLGGNRQSRARGIARAMLDTIPIVKFGDSPADNGNKANDLEMSATSSAARSELQNITSQHGRGVNEVASSEKNDAVVLGTNDAPPPAQDNQSGEGASRRAGLSNNEVPEQGLSATNTTCTNGDSNELGNAEDGLGCSICTDDFERGQDIRVLPCNHKFHPACVDPWLLDVSGTCPLCRIDLRPDGNRSNENDDDNSLPPPLDANHNEARRMSTLRTLFMFNRGSLSNASPEERIDALRRFRELNRRTRRAPTEVTADSSTEMTSDENRNRLSRLFRHRRSVVESNPTAPADGASHSGVESPSGNSTSHQ